MTPADRPETWQLLVLAYVDGELDPVSQLEVEAWIQTRPEVAELYHELQELSPKNRLFRVDAALPEPDPIDLRRSGEFILARLRPQNPKRSRAWLRPVVLSTLAASMAGLLLTTCPQEQPCEKSATVTAPEDPLAEFDDLPIASFGEARVIAIRGDHSPKFVAGADLLPDQLELATVEDVQIERTGRSAYSVPSAGDSPMIFQTRAK